MEELVRRSDVSWELPMSDGMLVPGLVFASEDLVGAADAEALRQVANVAHLPGIVEASMAMPDMHRGYGFPIGGVAGFSVDDGGVVSPGGVGYDIGCGVRLLASTFQASDVDARHERLMDELDRRIPRGSGPGAIADAHLLDAVLSEGAAGALAAGYGEEADLEYCEGRGRLQGARPEWVSTEARSRGASQIGSLGSGNHFLEVQIVDRIVDAETASAFGLSEGMVCVMIHCGSRGLGHQVCVDHVERAEAVMDAGGVRVPDRQLACVAVQSSEGEHYLGAMAAAANYSWANRHVLAAETRAAFAAAFSTDAVQMPLVYDIAHNLARLEDHDVSGTATTLCVHRKGATRSLPAHHADLTPRHRPWGQPVLLPGSMGTSSWVMRGTDANPALMSCAHGAGRVMSRRSASRRSVGADLARELGDTGIHVRPGSIGDLSEEAPYAYKDVDAVADVCRRAGLAAPVARLRPWGVVKG